MGIEVVGDEGRGQVPEVELEDGADTVDVVHDGAVPGQVGHPLLVKQGSAMIGSLSEPGWSDFSEELIQIDEKMHAQMHVKTDKSSL